VRLFFCLLLCFAIKVTSPGETNLSPIHSFISYHPLIPFEILPQIVTLEKVLAETSAKQFLVEAEWQMPF